MKDFGYFKHVVDVNKAFIDGYFFYRFKVTFLSFNQSIDICSTHYSPLGRREEGSEHDNSLDIDRKECCPSIYRTLYEDQVKRTFGKGFRSSTLLPNDRPSTLFAVFY